MGIMFSSLTHRRLLDPNSERTSALTYISLLLPLLLLLLLSIRAMPQN